MHEFIAYFDFLKDDKKELYFYINKGESNELLFSTHNNSLAFNIDSNFNFDSVN